MVCEVEVGGRGFGCHQLQVDLYVPFGIDVEVRTCSSVRGVRLKGVIWKKDVRVREYERAKLGEGANLHVDE